jgi:hypothetical protein
VCVGGRSPPTHTQLPLELRNSYKYVVKDGTQGDLELSKSIAALCIISVHKQQNVRAGRRSTT